jgi:hypothetical protein
MTSQRAANVRFMSAASARSPGRWWFRQFQVRVAPARKCAATRSGSTRSVTYSPCTTTGSV